MKKMKLKKIAKVERLRPTSKVLRSLYLKSGNLCAYPGCARVLINNQGVMIGRICHIKAASRGGKRFDKTMSNEERRAASNLILMCGDHHTVIDSCEKQYSVKKLQKWKEAHEQKFSAIGKTLKRAFKKQFDDSTDSIVTTLPKTCKRIHQTVPDAFADGDVPDLIAELSDYTNRLNKCPDEYREFMLALYKYAAKQDFDSDGGVVIHVDDVKHIFKLSDRKLKEYGKSLDRHGLGDIDEIDPDDWHFFLRHFSSFLTWADLNEFCKEYDIDPKTIIVDVKFGVFD